MSQATRKARDLRLDLFRGITMFIIFVAHVPGDPWNNWIPARFGFSSGGELFVFCSGAASAIAFGRVFLKRGWMIGTARIAFRMWQVYWAHICLFLMAAALAAGSDYLFAGSHNFETQFAPFLSDPARAIFAVVTLSWLPDYLDILPMYVAILGMVPVFMALRHLHPVAPLVASATLYALVWTNGLALPLTPWSELSWYFNPFAWQLIFFTGFSFMLGWLPAPRLRDRRMMAAAITFLVVSVPVCFWGIRDNFDVLESINQSLLGFNEKTNLHILRYVHFLALAYVALSVIEPWRDQIGQGFSRVIVTVGQQSLATFLASIATARVGWIMFETFGRGPGMVLLVNVMGFAAIIAVAYTVRWFKAEPWSSKAALPAGAVSRDRLTAAPAGAVRI